MTTVIGQEGQNFLVIEKELWTPAMALPDGSMVSKLEKGHYTWPFEIALPNETEVPDRKEKKIYPLPPSFTERASPAYINYKITVTMKRSALRVNQKCVYHSFRRSQASESLNSPQFNLGICICPNYETGTPFSYVTESM
jgi:hypothetical protein